MPEGRGFTAPLDKTSDSVLLSYSRVVNLMGSFLISSTLSSRRPIRFWRSASAQSTEQNGELSGSPCSWSRASRQIFLPEPLIIFPQVVHRSISTIAFSPHFICPCLSVASIGYSRSWYADMLPTISTPPNEKSRSRH